MGDVRLLGKQRLRRVLGSEQANGKSWSIQRNSGEIKHRLWEKRVFGDVKLST